MKMEVTKKLAFQASTLKTKSKQLQEFPFRTCLGEVLEVPSVAHLNATFNIVP